MTFQEYLDHHVRPQYHTPVNQPTMDPTYNPNLNLAQLSGTSGLMPLPPPYQGQGLGGLFGGGGNPMLPSAQGPGFAQLLSLLLAHVSPQLPNDPHTQHYGNTVQLPDGTWL